MPTHSLYFTLDDLLLIERRCSADPDMTGAEIVRLHQIAEEISAVDKDGGVTAHFEVDEE